MKEHIEALEDLLNTPAGENRAAAVRAAIEFMHAAEPMDEVAELEHCRKVALDIQTTFDPVGQVVRTRAAARADGHAAGYLQSIHAQRATEAALLPQVTQLRAENERLTESMMHEYGSANDAWEKIHLHVDGEHVHEYVLASGPRDGIDALAAGQCTLDELHERWTKGKAK